MVPCRRAGMDWIYSISFREKGEIWNMLYHRYIISSLESFEPLWKMSEIKIWLLNYFLLKTISSSGRHPQHRKKNPRVVESRVVFEKWFCGEPVVKKPTRVLIMKNECKQTGVFLISKTPFLLLYTEGQLNFLCPPLHHWTELNVYLHWCSFSIHLSSQIFPGDSFISSLLEFENVSEKITARRKYAFGFVRFQNFSVASLLLLQAKICSSESAQDTNWSHSEGINSMQLMLFIQLPTFWNRFCATKDKALTYLFHETKETFFSGVNQCVHGKN